jgi:hypothetical protein
MLGFHPLRTLTVGLGIALLAPVAAAFPAFDEDEIFIGDFTVVSSAYSDGNLELELTADLQNLAGGTFSFINAELAGGRASGLPFRVQAEGMLSYEDIEPWGITTPAKDSHTLILTIPRPQVRATLSALANDELVWELSGMETTIYQDGVFVMDDDTRDVYFPSDGIAGFDAWTDLLLDIDVGDTILFQDTCDDVGVTEEYLCAPKDPWEIVDIWEDDTAIWVEYELRDDIELGDVIESGTLTNAIQASGTGMHQSVFSNDNKLESCAVNPETEELECSFSGLYQANNDLSMGDNTALDGGINMRGVTAGLGVRIREGAVSEIGADFEFEYDTSMAVQAMDSDLEASWEEVLFEYSVPVVESQFAGVPLELSIEFVLSMGAEASFDSGAAFGLAQRGSVGVTFSEGDDGFEATPVFEVDPFLSSPPTLASDASGSFRAWLSLEAQLELDRGLVAGPSASMTGFTEFTVDAAADPWWEVSAGGEVEGTLELELLGFEVAAHTFGLSTETKQSVSSDTAAYTGATGLASGEEVRWAEDYHYGGTYGDYPVGLVPLDDGGLVFATWNPAVVARVDRAGQLQWDTYLTWPALGGIAHFDDGILAFGENGRALWVGELDMDGNEVQQHQYAFAELFDLSGVHVIDDGPTPSFLLKGTIQTSETWFRAWLAYVTYDPSNTDDPMTFHWSRVYDSQTTYGPYPDDFRALLWDDGDIYVGGVTTAGQPAGTISYNALVMQLDSNGDQVWANATVGGGDSVNAIALDDSGFLLTAGSYSQIVTQVAYFHAAWFGRFHAADGTYYNGIGLSEDLWWESYPDTSGYPSYTTPGASIYDTPSWLQPLADGGYAAMGYSGLGNKVGWILSLDSSLSVRWMSTLEGLSGGSNLPVYLADTGHGLAVLSQTTSPTIEGYGGGAMDTMLLSFPYDGILSFDPATGMNSRYTKPDMVAPPYDGTQEALTYVITDNVPTHEASTIGFSEAGISSWSLDPWESTPAPMTPSRGERAEGRQRSSASVPSPVDSTPSRGR